MREKQVIVIGGGITGLTVAYQLQKLANQHALPISCKVFEQDTRFGGKIRSHRTDELTVELGPDSIFTPKLVGRNFIQELDLQNDVVASNPSGGTYVLHNRSLQPLPTGMFSGIPTDLGAFARTSLLSPVGKARALADLFLPSMNINSDMSLGRFLRRQLGNEVVDVMIAPMMAGIHAADIDHLSLDAVMPSLRQIYEKHRSLIRGAMNQKKQRASVAQQIEQPMFISLQNGLESLVERLLERLQDETALVSRTQALRICKRSDSGYDVTVHRAGKQTVLRADAVVITTPAFSAAKMLSGLSLDAQLLNQIRYVSTATILVGYPKNHLESRIPGSGFLIPRSEPTPMTACTVVSKKWAHAVRSHQTVLRWYVGRDGAEAAVDWSDELLISKITRDLEDVIGSIGDPEFRLVTRWHHAMPQYDVGHLDRVEAIEKQLIEYPGIVLAGSAYRGMGIPDCIQDATRAALRISELFTSTDGKRVTA